MTDGLTGRRLADRFEVGEPLDFEEIEVYGGRDVRLDRPVHVRIVPGPVERAAFADRLGAAEALAHPNAQRVLAGGVLDDGRAWYAFEPIDGPTLGRVLDREGGALDVKRVLHIGRQLATALQAAHRHSLVHGRLDPWHVRLTEAYGSPDWVVVTGFAHRDPEPHEEWTAPEPGAPTAAADLYLLGAMLHVMATGSRPGDLRPGEKLPVPLDGVVPRLLDADPARRPSAELVVAHIDGSSAYRLGGVEGEHTGPPVPATSNAQVEAAAQPLFFILGGLVAAAVVALLGGLGLLWNEKRKDADTDGEHLAVVVDALRPAAVSASPLRTPLPDQGRAAFLTALAHRDWGTSGPVDLSGLDPAFAPGQLVAADLWTNRALDGDGTAWKAVSIAGAAALALDPEQLEARAPLALAGAATRQRWDAAEEELAAVVAVRPRSTHPHRWYAALLTARGRFALAVREARAAVDLDPLAAPIRVELAEVHRRARNYPAALAELTDVLTTNPELVEAHRALGRTLLALGRHDEALSRFERAGDDPGRVRALAGAGRLADARALLPRIDTAVGLAAAYAALGERERAVAWLDRAVSQSDGPALFLAVDPEWDGLRGDPAFERVVERLALR